MRKIRCCFCSAYYPAALKLCQPWRSNGNPFGAKNWVSMASDLSDSIADSYRLAGGLGHWPESHDAGAKPLSAPLSKYSFEPVRCRLLRFRAEQVANDHA